MDEGPAGRQEGAATRAAQAVLGMALLFVVAVNVANAAGRHLAGAGIVGADELMTFTMVWIVFAGAVLAMAGRDHIAVSLLPERMSPRTRTVLHAAHDALALAVCLYAAWASWGYVSRIAGIGMTSMALGVPLAIPHAALPLGYLGLAAVAGRALVRDVGRLVRPRRRRSA